MLFWKAGLDLPDFLGNMSQPAAYTIPEETPENGDKPATA